MSKNIVSKNPLAGITLPSKQPSEKKVKEKAKNSVSRKVPTPRSFRLSYEEIDLLKEITESLSEFAGRHIKINDTLVLRALIRLYDDKSQDDIFEKIKEIKMES